MYCPAGDFHIDPWRPVDRAVITHAHADHARWGSRHYLGSAEGNHVLRTRMGASALIQTAAYGEKVTMNRARVSLHPAGHILGSAQVRVEVAGEVWVVSGDYKTDPEPTCTPFEPMRCHRFVTESTFGLPIYRWRPEAEIAEEVNAWWQANREQGKASMLLGYALGKAQRLLAMLAASVGPIYTHGAVEKLNKAYRASGVKLPETTPVGAMPRKHNWAGAMIVAPPSVHGATWPRRFQPLATAMASGWMTIRGTRRRKAVDRGFILSDHADWPGLTSAIEATGAESVGVTHGYTAVLARWLAERGVQADTIATHFVGEADEPAAAEETES